MADFIITKEEYKKFKKTVPFTKYDGGWVLLCIGMAIGSGIVFMPVQIGLKGIWVFLAAIAIAYPAMFILQRLYIDTLSQTDECFDCASIITSYLGKKWGILLGFVYFLMDSSWNARIFTWSRF